MDERAALRRLTIKSLFIQGPSIASRLVIVCIISVVLMAIDHRQHHLESIRATLSLVVYPLQYVVNMPFSAADWAGEKLSTRETLLEENAQLRTQQQLLMAQLQKLSVLQTENTRLRELLQSSKSINEHVLVAELLAVDLEPFTRKIVINRGSTDDVYRGQPLLDAEGIMGQVIHVGPFSSTAMLITDPNHAIPVHVNRNGLRAIAMGTGAPDEMDIPYLPNSADIEVGDLLTSSGLGGRFPRDYPVAKVTSVIKEPSKPYAVVKAKPTAMLETTREVLLVWSEQTSQAVADGEPAMDASTEPGAANTPAAAAEPVANQTPNSETVVSPASIPGSVPGQPPANATNNATGNITNSAPNNTAPAANQPATGTGTNR